MINKVSKDYKIFLSKINKYLNYKEISELQSELDISLKENYHKFYKKPFYKIIKKNEYFVLSDPKFIEFWQKYQFNKWENNLFRVLDQYLNEDTTFVDIGAWIGPVTLYAAKISKKVISVEPDPVAFKILKEHIDINNLKNVSLDDSALTEKTSDTILLGSKSFGNSGTSIYNLENEQIKVKAVNFANFIKIKDISNDKIFFKMDIEGAEFEIIKKYNFLFKQLNNNIHITFHPIIFYKKIKKEKIYYKSQLIFISYLYFFYFKKLPYKYLYFNNLKKMYFIKLLVKVFLYGIPEEIHIFGTNKK
jgi:FkbM family methyltransferase